MGSILNDVKEFCQVPEFDDGFNTVLLMNINMAIMTLAQLGVGPPEGFSVKGPDETWASLVGDPFDYEAVKTYVCLKVKMVFDPPSSGTVSESYLKLIDELTWRLREQAEGVFDS